MNYFILTFALTFVSYSIQQATPPNSAETEAHIKQCTASTNANPDIVQKLMENGELTDDPKLKCFIKCLAVKVGRMTESGEVLVDNFKGHVDSKIIDTCKDKKGSDPCDVAFNISKCIIEEEKKAHPN